MPPAGILRFGILVRGAQLLKKASGGRAFQSGGDVRRLKKWHTRVPDFKVQVIGSGVVFPGLLTDPSGGQYTRSLREITRKNGPGVSPGARQQVISCPWATEC
jgi:hypothetical protein